MEADGATDSSSSEAEGLFAERKMHLKILELFSGIGGMHCGVLHAQRLRAFRRMRRLSLHQCHCGRNFPVETVAALCACSFFPGSDGTCRTASPERDEDMAICEDFDSTARSLSDGLAGLDTFVPFQGDFEALRLLRAARLDGSEPCVHPRLAAFSVEMLEKVMTSEEGGAECGRVGPAFSFQIEAALDVNESAMAVYRHNFCALEKRSFLEAAGALSANAFSERQADLSSRSRLPRVCATFTRGIEFLPLSFYSESAADAWLLAPPCQPFARRGKLRDKQDSRCCALLRLTQVLRSLKQEEQKLTEKTRLLPSFLLLENVVGFNGSDAYEELMEALVDICAYTVYTLLLNPIHFGIPNCRSRCFVVARRKGLPGDGPYAKWFHESAPYSASAGGKLRPAVLSYIPGVYSGPAFFCCPLWRLERFLHPRLPPRTEGEEETGASFSSLLKALELSEERKKREWHMVDLVGSLSARSSCFTKSYGKSGFAQYGSVLLMQPLSKVLAQIESNYVGSAADFSDRGQERGMATRRNVELHDILPPSTRCRFFSVREQLNLHGFPQDFAFCELDSRDGKVATAQGRASAVSDQRSQLSRYRVMIGNSLNVYLVGMLLDFLLGDDAFEPQLGHVAPS